MARVLIVYASRYGQTARIAGRLAEQLDHAGHQVTLQDIRQGQPPAAADLVVVGAPIYAGRYARSLVRWLERAHPAPARSVFFNVSGSASSADSRGREQALEHAAQFLRRLDWRPSRVEAFAGAIPYTRYGLITRWMMKRIIGRAGGDTDTSRDYEYTDWGAVDDFAAELSARLRA